LPPVLGVIPAFFDCGIVRAVYVAWRRPMDQADSAGLYEKPSPFAGRDLGES
jgi:hypothetical protein